MLGGAYGVYIVFCFLMKYMEKRKAMSLSGDGVVIGRSIFCECSRSLGREG